MKRDPASLAILMDKANFMHEKGFNCAETALWALSCYWNADISTACVTGLGGGVARSGATCGALLGAIAGIGARVGRVDPADDAKKALCYKLGQQAIAKFTQEMGTTVCKDIIGFVLGEPGGAERYAQGGFKGGSCKVAIEAAIRAAIEAAEGITGEED